MTLCLDAFNSVAGYLAWKRNKIELLASNNAGRYDRSLLKHGFISRPGGPEINLAWKEARYKPDIKKTYTFQEEYTHFYLFDKFDNDTFSYTAEEINPDSGELETVKYQIMETDGSQITTILNALNIPATSLETIKPVPLPLRVWTISSNTDPNYFVQFVGRLVDMNVNNPIVTRFFADENDNLISQNQSYLMVRYDNADINYVNTAKNTLTYNQTRKHIIYYNGLVDGSMSPPTIADDVSEYIKIYVYEYDFNSRQYSLKRIHKKTLYRWMDIANRSCSVGVELGKYSYVSAKVRKTYANNCYREYNEYIGSKRTDTHNCKFYHMIHKEWTPSVDPSLDTTKNCFLDSRILQSLSGITPYSYNMSQVIESQIEAVIYTPRPRPNVSALDTVEFFLKPAQYNNENIRLTDTRITNLFLRTINANNIKPYMEFGRLDSGPILVPAENWQTFEY